MTVIPQNNRAWQESAGLKPLPFCLGRKKKKWGSLSEDIVFRKTSQIVKDGKSGKI